MSLVKSTSPIDAEDHPLIQSFLEQKNQEDFPFSLALSSLEKLESSCSGQDELDICLLEDIVFSSIYATFYEAIFAAIKDNPKIAANLVEQFEKSTPEREQLIARQGQHHIDYILNSGKCKGCPSCQHHRDVLELLPQWQNKNRDFFITLYLGMQTIQFAMEHLLYEVVPYDNSIIPLLGQKDILHFRQFLYRYAETHN